MYESMPTLLVEDDYNDILLIQRAFRKANVHLPLSIVSDGDEAILYLQRKGKYADADRFPLPSLIILDLKLPRRSGLEVLAWIASQPNLRRLLIVVLTSSQESIDLDRAYDLGANSYLVKPIDFQDFVSLVELVDAYWFKLNQRPRIAAE